MPDWQIPLSDLSFGPEEQAAAVRVVDSKWLSMGPEVRAFETEFAAMQEAKYAFAVSNATAALHLAFLALNLGPGDEVIQPALNFVASANMTVATGATPVFGDIISLEEPTLDPEQAEQLITPRTKAIVVMHYGGNLCRMEEFQRLCAKHHLALIEDACHAVGVRYTASSSTQLNGKMAGSIGDISAFSFFANKNLATGEGGMMVTQRDDIAERVRLLRSHGMTSLTWDRHQGHAYSYDVRAHGYNYRMDEIHAAIGRVQLTKLQQNNEARRRVLAFYHERFKTLPNWLVPFCTQADKSSGHLMVAIAPTAGVRQSVIDKLREMGIQTSLHYPCIADFNAFQFAANTPLPKTRKFTQRAISLPLFPALPRGSVETICVHFS